MKKIISIVLTLVLLSTVAATPVLATETTSEVVATYEDGSYLVVTTTEITSSNARSSTISKSGSRTASYYNALNVEQWNYTLQANFLYRTGVSAQCQNRTTSYNILKSGWSKASENSWIGDNSAHGTITMEYTVLFITTETVTHNLNIYCDAYGNLTYS